MAADRPSFFALVRSRPRLVALLTLLLACAGGTGVVLYQNAQQARLQRDEQLQEQRLRLESRQQVLALQRQEEALLREDRLKQQLAARDTAQFQLASLHNDLAKQDRQVRILRREAADRQVALVEKERQRRKKELETLMREEIKTELEKSDSAACIQAYDAYKLKKADPTTPADEVVRALGALRDLCNNKAAPAAS